MGMGHLTEKARSGSGSREGKSRKEGEEAWINLLQGLRVKSTGKSGRDMISCSKKSVPYFFPSPLTRIPQQKSSWTLDLADGIGRRDDVKANYDRKQKVRKKPKSEKVVCLIIEGPPRKLRHRVGRGLTWVNLEFSCCGVDTAGAISTERKGAPPSTS